MRQNRKMQIWAAAAAALALMVGGVTLSTASAQTAQEKASPNQKAVTTVGVYQPRKVFGKYHLRDQFVGTIRKLQKQMQAARKNKDRKQMMQIEQQMQQAQQHVFKQFTADTKRVMPQVAKEANVQLVAVDVAYKAPGIKTKDVTDLVIKHINAGAKKESAKPKSQSNSAMKAPMIHPLKKK